MIRQIKSKDKLNFIDYCSKKDKYSDFYITKNNKRLYLNDYTNAKICLNDALKRGNKIIVCEEKNTIKGAALILGFADKNPKRYLQLLTNNDNITKNILKYIFWNIKEDLYIKVKLSNPLGNLLERNHFKKIANRGNENLYLHKQFIRTKKNG